VFTCIESPKSFVTGSDAVSTRSTIGSAGFVQAAEELAVKEVTSIVFATVGVTPFAVCVTPLGVVLPN